jgi:epoxyqueuosine reductase
MNGDDTLNPADGSRVSAATDVEAAELSAWIKRQAHELGFQLVGIAPAVIGLGADRLARWLADGRHGEMTYMQAHEPARTNPNLVLEGARSVIMVGLGYATTAPAPVRTGFARISRYAWGRDYHDVIRRKLDELARRLLGRRPGVRCRAVVDTAPLMERDYGRLAGLGWIGKNTLLLNRRLGSWFFLGALLVDCALVYDLPFTTDHCGTCTRCLDACPTSAFDGPYQLDPRRCISYLTIEHRSPIGEAVRGGLGDWVFGCDVCQEVCPWNRDAPAAREPEFEPGPETNPIPIIALLGLGEEEFRAKFRGTPLFRARRHRLLRNAAIVAANQGDRNSLPALEALCGDADPVVRETARWAVARLRFEAAATNNGEADSSFPPAHERHEESATS